MKIAIYNTSISGGGAERFTVLLSKGLADKGYEIHLLTGAREKGEYQVADNVLRVILHTKKSFFSNSISLYHYLTNNKIDICLAVGIYPNLVATLAKNFNLKTSIIISERNAPKHDLLSWKSKLLRKLLYWRADAYVFQTPGAKACYSKSIQKRSVVIPNPLKENLPVRSNNPKKEIVAVGRLMPQKNYELLLSAFSKLCRQDVDYTLHIYGQGIYESHLRNYAKRLEIDNKVFFEGFKDDVHSCIKDSDIYVLSSDFEGLPNALMEAMAMGFPVVSTDCPPGGPRMLIEHGVNGLLVPVGDVATLFNAMLKLINNKELKDIMGKNATETLKKYYLNNIIDLWEKFLSSKM